MDALRQDHAEPKQKFRQMRDKVDSTTSYANDWLPDKYRDPFGGGIGIDSSGLVFKKVHNPSVNSKWEVDAGIGIIRNRFR